MNQCQD